MSLKKRVTFLLKASALTHAVFICLVIAMFCGSLVLISHYNAIFTTRLKLNTELIHHNQSAFTYFLSRSQQIPYNQPETANIFQDGIYSTAEKKYWGFYDILTCQSVFKSDTITKTALIGKATKQTQPIALYVTNYDKTLKLSGNTNLSGRLKIPYGSYDYGYVNNKVPNRVTIKGVKQKSEKLLPKIDKDIVFETGKLPEINREQDNGTIVNSFKNDTKVLRLEGNSTLGNLTCKGNIIITANKTLEIKKSAKLEDVVVIAPKVIVNSGFKGNIQIVAKQEVILKRNAQLLYPSSIYINSKDSVAVTLEKQSKLAGGIVLTGGNYQSSLKRTLTLNEGSTVVGTIYCYGKTQLQGAVIGSLFTDRVFLQTKSSYTENIIFNGTVNRDSLPSNFIELPLFNTAPNTNYHVIKTL